MTRETTDELRPERYRSYLLVLARINLRTWGPVAHKVDASDVVQEALLQAHVALSQFRGTTSAELEAWLRTILANKLTDAVRHFSRKKRDAAREQSIRESLDESAARIKELAADQTSPSQYVLRHERAIRLADALEALPDDQRKAFELYHVEGHSVAEVAKQMDRTKASVAGLLRRGLKVLRDRLQDLG